MSFATKRIGPSCYTLFTFVTCCSLPFILSQNYLLPLISVLAENTLLKTACHFLLLLVGFDTLTYRKDYDRSPILVGHQATACCRRWPRCPLPDAASRPSRSHSRSRPPSSKQSNDHGNCCVRHAWYSMVTLMTHKCRGSIVVLSISKSVEPNEEQKEMTSGFEQGIFCRH